MDRVERGDPHLQAELSDDEDEVAPTQPIAHAIQAEAVDTDNIVDDGQQPGPSGEANVAHHTPPSMVANIADSDAPTCSTAGEIREEESPVQPDSSGLE